MKTPREIVEPIYEGDDYQDWRILGMTCGALEALIKTVQEEAWNSAIEAACNSCTDSHIEEGIRELSILSKTT